MPSTPTLTSTKDTWFKFISKPTKLSAFTVEQYFTPHPPILHEGPADELDYIDIEVLLALLYRDTSESEVYRRALAVVQFFVFFLQLFSGR